jgi:hypothetical protein
MDAARAAGCADVMAKGQFAKRAPQTAGSLAAAQNPTDASR